MLPKEIILRKSIAFRELPGDKPRVTSAHNISSNSVYLAWEKPNLDIVHGELLGYQLSYKARLQSPHSRGGEEVTMVTIKGPNVTDYTISNLAPYTEYLVSLEIVNPEGTGPATTVKVSTDEGGMCNPSLFFNLSLLKDF